jgi:hypothetical protein
MYSIAYGISKLIFQYKNIFHIVYILFENFIHFRIFCQLYCLKRKSTNGIDFVSYSRNRIKIF